MFCKEFLFKEQKTLLTKLFFMLNIVGMEGIEPTTPLMTMWYSTFELHPIRIYTLNYFISNIIYI